MMARFLIPLLAILAVCAAKPSAAKIDRNLLSQIIEKLQQQRRSLDDHGLDRDDIRFASHLTVMGLVQKCEMFLFYFGKGPMEMVENYFLGNETVSDGAHGHICPIVFLVAKGYMEQETDEDLLSFTDSLLPLMEEAMCANIVMNREAMEYFAPQYDVNLDDRLAKIKQAEEALLNQCMEEFEKGDVEEIVDDLVEKLFFSDKK